MKTLATVLVLALAASATHADECSPQTMQNEKFILNLFDESPCGWSSAVAWSPTNDTAATTKLCQDKECLPNLETKFTTQADCTVSGVNRKKQYADQFGLLISECKKLGIAVSITTSAPTSALPSESAKSAAAPSAIGGSIAAATALVVAAALVM
jgi:hypothetical protein